MTQINTGGGEAAVTLTGGYPLEIIDPTDRRAVVTDMSRLFPGGQFSLEFTGPDRNALVYTSPDNAIKASRPLGSAAAQVVVAEGRRLELTAVRAYQEVARGIGDAESSDLDPAQPTSTQQPAAKWKAYGHLQTARIRLWQPNSPACPGSS